jgi:hypothetical protein
MTGEVECAACHGTGTVEDEIHMHTLVKIVRLVCTDCHGAGVVEEEDFEAEIFEMTPRQFAGVATFGLASLASSMLFGIALLHVWRVM